MQNPTVQPTDGSDKIFGFFIERGSVGAEFLLQIAHLVAQRFAARRTTVRFVSGPLLFLRRAVRH